MSATCDDCGRTVPPEEAKEGPYVDYRGRWLCLACITEMLDLSEREQDHDRGRDPLAALRAEAVRRPKVLDWRGKPIPVRTPPVTPRVNPVTGRPICVLCAEPLEGMSGNARFCSHACRSRYHKGERAPIERRRTIPTEFVVTRLGKR